MRLGSGMHVEWVEKEAVVLNVESGELHYLNTPAALVLALIEEHGYDKALEVLRSGHDLQPGEEDEVRAAIDEMVEKGILVGD